MEKDKILKLLKFPILVYNFTLLIFNKLVAQVHYLDPSDNTRKRIISSLIMIPIALFAIFNSQKLFIFLAIVTIAPVNNVLTFINVKSSRSEGCTPAAAK